MQELKRTLVGKGERIDYPILLGLCVKNETAIEESTKGRGNTKCRRVSQSSG